MNKEKKTKNRMKCEDVQANLVAYITNDAGYARTELIKKHLENCTACQTESAQIKEALNFLHGIHKDEDIPTKLSNKRRKLIIRSFMHPVLDFIYRHHIIISIIVAIITIAVSLCTLRQVKIWHSEKLETGISVSIKHNN